MHDTIDIGASFAQYHAPCTFHSLRSDVFYGAQLSTEAVTHSLNLDY
jgi:hypothetical protein